MDKNDKKFYTLLGVIGGMLAASILAFSYVPSPTYQPTTKTLSSPQSPISTAPVAKEPTKEVTRINPPANRSVFINGPIDESGLVIASKILELGASEEPMYIILRSPGGNVLVGDMIVSAIEAAKGPVYTVCDTLCASMAAMIFEYGKERYIVDRSFVMFHPASNGVEGELDKNVSRLLAMQRHIGKMEAYVAKRAGITYDKYKQLSGVELWLDAEDAVSSNFADKIVSVFVNSSEFHLTAPEQKVFAPKDLVIKWAQ